MKKILFSPIGGTDPIKYDHDGSMLHICRFYKPDIVYLYLSKEMYEIHQKDNRYVLCIEQLGKDLNHKFDIRLIVRQDLTEVQEYDFFYEDFSNEIENIKNEMDNNDVLIFNMASGTPAMKSALLIISTIAQYKYIPVQVPTPKKSINSQVDERKDFDLELFWQFNEDNSPQTVNRCKENKCLNLVAMLKKDLIKQYIKTYNYSAAFQIAKEIKNYLSEESYELINLANERLKLNFSVVDKILAKHKQYDIYPIKSSSEKSLFEYVLSLNIKVGKEEYADFLRAITPLSTDLCELILKSQCGIYLEEYTILDNKKIRRWANIKGTQIHSILCSKFPDFENRNNQKSVHANQPVYSSHLEVLILELSNNDQIYKSIKSLQDVEQKLRNVAAHEIVSVTEEWFVKNIGKNPKEVFELIKDLLKLSLTKITNDDWKSYDHMNDILISSIK